MATAPTLPLVSVDEYLTTSYRPDVDFVDGVLVERGMSTVAHGFLQRLLLFWFAKYEKAFGFVAVPEIRTRIIERARYRVPDVMLCPTPIRRERAVTTVPLAVIETLSPDDRLSEVVERFADHAHIGVKALVLMDPEKLVAYRFENGSLIQTEIEELVLTGGQTVPFSTSALFRELTEALNEAS